MPSRPEELADRQRRLMRQTREEADRIRGRGEGRVPHWKVWRWSLANIGVSPWRKGVSEEDR